LSVEKTAVLGCFAGTYFMRSKAGRSLTLPIDQTPVDRLEREWRKFRSSAFSWQHRITRVRERCSDLFGNDGWQWRVHRRSNAYVFRDPQQLQKQASIYQSENRFGTQNQHSIGSVPAPSRELERALARFGEAVTEKERTLK
jgi:hypothetical protein